jgi:hypothetical protein
LLYNSNLPIENKDTLKSHKKILKKLADRSGPIEQKRKLLKKHGHHILPSVAHPVLQKLANDNK